MVAIPIEHVNDAHSLIADGKISLYELTPSVGSGVIRFKTDDTQVWKGLTFTGIPMSLSGEGAQSSGAVVMPTMDIGQPDMDLSAFKPLIWSGGLDNARIVKYEVLLDNLINNRDIKESKVYRVKRVDSYSASQIKLTLATFSPTGPSTIPFRLYIPPAFPFVVL